MSLNAYFTYSVVIGRAVHWQTALGIVFHSGILYLLLTLTKAREHIINGIPDCLKHGTAAGIGLFIAFIGLRRADVRLHRAREMGRLQRIPAFMTVVATPLTFRIATGLSLGLLSFTFGKVGSGRYQEISPLMWMLWVLFLRRCIPR